ncbi:YraN family protein [Shewanella violacea]|uniref:UPF0102 protein SVI_3991 n=1 Tax=Shewanella violacea (strain JCM 10179 / CIP 106290 / LMG 19151 / DSS12) TaxID=637905 RepID=D4ZDQ1_SHEVD|nr:YraN family protein [Shewanella violacea]BAJ03962.1 conserved hypothetical protein [Shewanella violacea DSS12]
MDDKHHIPREHGQLGENLARTYLEQQGLTFVAKNVRYKFGEIDLVMQQGKTLVFVEVKYRSKSQFGGALHALSTKQIQRLRRAAEHYMQLKHLDVICRFDLIGVEPAQIYWLKNAF